MKLFLLIVILSAIDYVLIKVIKKWQSKFTLTFIFGKKGSGKSTLLVKEMYRYAKLGFTIYTNMQDCTFPTARIIRIDDIGPFIPDSQSVVLLDEVGIDYDARKFKTFRDDTRDFYKYQRHYEVVVIMASQTWDVDKKVRDLTDKFYLCQSIGPISIARRIARKTILTESIGDQESRISDNLKFTFPIYWKYTWIPKWSKYFNSFIAPKKPSIRYKENESPYKIIRKKKGIKIVKNDKYEPRGGANDQKRSTAPRPRPAEETPVLRPSSFVSSETDEVSRKE